MAITDYSTLQSEVVTWLHRSDAAGTLVQQFIADAEHQLNHALLKEEFSQFEARATASTASGDDRLSRPTGSKGIRTIKIQGDSGGKLSYMTPHNMTNIYHGYANGIPRAWTIDGDELRLAPTPDGVYTVEVTYWKAPTALSTSNSSNWYITDAPNLIKYKALEIGSLYFLNLQAAGSWGMKANSIFNDVIDQDERIKWSGDNLTMSVG